MGGGVEGGQINFLEKKNEFQNFYFFIFFYITGLKSTLHPPPSTLQTIYNFKKHINY